MRVLPVHHLGGAVVGIQVLQTLLCVPPVHAMNSDLEAFGLARLLGEAIIESIREDQPDVRFFVAVFDEDGHAGAFSTGDMRHIRKILSDFLTAQ